MQWLPYRWVFQDIFFIIPYKFFWAILNMFSWNLNTFTKITEQVCFLFICSFFTGCFAITFLLTLSTFCTFPTISSTKEKTKSFTSNTYLNMTNLFVYKITSESNNKQDLVLYFHKHVTFLRLLFLKELARSIIVHALFE